MATLTVQSFGCGVQSVTMTAMAALGELPRPDRIIMADTGWERTRTYQYFEWFRGWLEDHGMSVQVVSAGSIKTDVLGHHKRAVSMPLYCHGDTIFGGMLKRQCTKEYKVEPVRKAIREHLGLLPRQRAPKGTIVNLWLGISTDETQRCGINQTPSIINTYPLINSRMSRADCLRWLTSHGFVRPPRSACVGCPNRGDREWVEMRDDGTNDFRDACEWESNLPLTRWKKRPFIHKSLRPLGEVVFDEHSEMFNHGCGDGLTECGVADWGCNGN